MTKFAKKKSISRRLEQSFTRGRREGTGQIALLAALARGRVGDEGTFGAEWFAGELEGTRSIGSEAPSWSRSPVIAFQVVERLGGKVSRENLDERTQKVHHYIHGKVDMFFD